MRYAVVYWASFAVVAVTMLLQSMPRILSGQYGISTLVSVAVAVVILLAALLGLRTPERSGAPTEPGPLLYLMVIAALLSTGSLVFAMS